MDIELKCNYTIDLEQLKKVILSTCDLFEKVVKDTPPRIGVTSIDPDGYKVIANLWVQSHGFEDTRLAYQEKLIQNLKAADVKLPGM